MNNNITLWKNRVLLGLATLITSHITNAANPETPLISNDTITCEQQCGKAENTKIHVLDTSGKLKLMKKCADQCAANKTKNHIKTPDS